MQALQDSHHRAVHISAIESRSQRIALLEKARRKRRERAGVVGQGRQYLFQCLNNKLQREGLEN